MELNVRRNSYRAHIQCVFTVWQGLQQLLTIDAQHKTWTMAEAVVVILYNLSNNRNLRLLNNSGKPLGVQYAGNL